MVQRSSSHSINRHIYHGWIAMKIKRAPTASHQGVCAGRWGTMHPKPHSPGGKKTTKNLQIYVYMYIKRTRVTSSPTWHGAGHAAGYGEARSERSARSAGMERRDGRVRGGGNERLRLLRAALTAVPPRPPAARTAEPGGGGRGVGGGDRHTQLRQKMAFPPACLSCLLSPSLLSVESKTEQICRFFFFLIIFVIFIICIFSYFLRFHLIPFISFFNRPQGGSELW